MKTPLPTLHYEKELWNKEYLVIGVDEVGRGCLAGPVAVGAVCLSPVQNVKTIECLGVNDSKKLSGKQRYTIKDCLKPHVLASSVVFSSVKTINNAGIVPAVNQAARKAIKNILKMMPANKSVYLLTDAFPIPRVPTIGKNQKAIIHGDCISISIASAAILAKIERDEYMSKLHKRFKKYGWDENKGYGTQFHRDSIIKHGITIHHRSLYVRNLLKTG